jgi:hypothetical protein
MKSPVGTPLSLMVSVCTLFALLLVGGCKSEEKGRTASLPPPLVGVMTVEERNVPVSFTYAGQTEGSRAVEVRAQVSGILMRRAYDEGQYVKQGQLLFEIEPDTYRAALRQANGVMEQAQAKFTQARQNLNRVLPLYKKNAVSQKDRDDAQAAYDSAKADLDSAKAAVSEAEIKLSHAYVTAPVAGFAFFLFGLWRKGIVLLAVGLFLYAPLILPTDASALTDILIEAYTPYYQALQALALLFVLLFCLGRGFWALLAFLTFAAVFLYGSFHTERLYIGLGFGTAYAWLNMSIIWKALFQAGLFSLLGRCWLGFAAILIDGLALWYVGLPLNLPVSVLPAAAFPVFCGMMATYDRYRKDVLRETFWW